MVATKEIRIKTRGNTDIIDITQAASKAISESHLSTGIACLFVIGSTAGLTTVEYEPGLVNSDLPRLFEELAPENAHYEHEATWHDDNGHSHVRASLLGSSLTVPFVQGKLTLGTWQQIILIDFDTRARERTVIVQLMGG